MSKQILRVHINGTEPNDFMPNVAELTEMLPQVGFRPLTDATPDTLPVGAIAVIYNCINHQMFVFMVYEHFHGGFSYIPFGALNDLEPEIEHISRKYEFNNRLYKVLIQLPVTDSKPHVHLLPAAIEEAGFLPLAEATPESLPEGALVFLYTNPCMLSPVIVRVLSKQFEGDHRFLYWRQNAITAGDWFSDVIMDKLKPFKNYYYWVVS